MSLSVRFLSFKGERGPVLYVLTSAPCAPTVADVPPTVALNDVLPITYNVRSQSPHTEEVCESAESLGQGRGGPWAGHWAGP